MRRPPLHDALPIRLGEPLDHAKSQAHRRPTAGPGFFEICFTIFPPRHAAAQRQDLLPSGQKNPAAARRVALPPTCNPNG